MIRKLLPTILAPLIVMALVSPATDPKTSLAAGLLTLLVGYALSLFFKKSSSDDDLLQPEYRGLDQQSQQETADDLIARFGEPDDLILLDPTRGNEPQGIILVYQQQGFIVAGGEKMPISDIADVTFNNAAMAYLPNSYQLIVTPKNKELPLRHLPLGNDGEWALQATEQLRQYLK